MMHRYSFGEPMDTGAVVMQVKRENGEIPYLTSDRAAGSFSYQMADDDIV